MSAVDTLLPFTFQGAAYLTIEGGGSGQSVNVLFEGSVSASIVGRAVSEARHRGRHASGTPIVIETEDGNISLQISGKATSMLGSSQVSLYGAAKGQGAGAGWSSTGRGTAKLRKITLTPKEADSGSTQSIVFNYCHCDSFDITSDDEKFMGFTSSWTDFENYPSIS